MLVVGVVLGLVVLEIGLRVVRWPVPGYYAESGGRIELRAAGREGGGFAPGSGRMRHYDYDVAWTVNSDGFRERELRPKTSGEWRIGLLGDSMTAGVGVEAEERFGAVWWMALRSHVPDVTVWNVASSRCGTWCELEILEGVGKKYELDEIMLAFFGGNDLEDNLVWRPGEMPSKRPASDSVGETVRTWLRTYSRLATFTWVTGLRAFANVQPPGIYSVADLEKHWPATERALARLREVVGERPLTVLYVPATPEWDDRMWQELRDRYSLTDSGRFVVRDAVVAWARDNDVRLIDASLWLRECPTARECVFRIDSHWNPRGHYLVGQRLARVFRTAREVQHRDLDDTRRSHVSRSLE